LASYGYRRRAERSAALADRGDRYF